MHSGKAKPVDLFLHCGQSTDYQGVKSKDGDWHEPCKRQGMNLLVLLLILMLVFGGGGFYLGGPVIGGSGFGLILLILVVLALTGRLGSR